MMSKIDDITANFTGASSSAGAHQRWVNANIETNTSTIATFMSRPISGGICKALLPTLDRVEVALKKLGDADTLGIRTVSGYQGPPDFHGYHSWGLAIDINYVTNPYIMNESGEKTLDAQLAPVFNRIARFMIEADLLTHRSQDSIIPQLGGARWSRNREVYRALQVESQAMKDYFAFMQNGAELQQYLESRDGRAAYQRAFASGKTPGAPATPDANFVRAQMRQDWMVLTSRNPVPRMEPPPTSSTIPHPVVVVQMAAPVPSSMDRPFDGPASKGSPLLPGRSPLNGYLDLSWNLIDALVSNSLVWGAVGFGSESGDIMHFDARNLTSLTFAGGKTIGDLNRFIHS
jgi:hypothetical protein